MMAAGLERQLDRCSPSNGTPDFCTDAALYAKVKSAYNHLWDVIEANSAQLSQEVWSWIYQNGAYQLTPLGSLPPPAGVSPTGMLILVYESLLWFCGLAVANLEMMDANHLCRK